MTTSQLQIKRMGVINLTPNSFSDGGEVLSLESLQKKVGAFGNIDALDIGAESTAPMNDPIHPDQEWDRLSPYLPYLISLKIPISIDTYHPETIGRIAGIWITEKIKTPLIWNDVSGKFDQAVKSYLAMGDNFYYVYCHNLAPIREMTGRHMNFLSNLRGEAFRDELASYFRPMMHSRVIFDPAFGFSKTFEQNWDIINHFGDLQKKVGHAHWLLGISRKSFLRKKLGIETLTLESKKLLDHFHSEILLEMIPSLKGNLWIRTHRPELIVTPL